MATENQIDKQLQRALTIHHQSLAAKSRPSVLVGEWDGMRYQLKVWLSTWLAPYSQKYANVRLWWHHGTRGENNPIIKLELWFQMIMRASQYGVHTNSWMLFDLQRPIGAVRSDGAKRRRRLTAKEILTADLGGVCWDTESAKKAKHLHSSNYRIIWTTYMIENWMLKVQSCEI